MKISPSNKIKRDFAIQPSKIRGRSKNSPKDFNFSSEKEKKENLKNLLHRINKKGRQIISTNSLRALHEYRTMIQEYLSIILQDGFYIKKIDSPWNGMDSLTIVSILDKEIAELSTLLLDKEKEHLAIISKVDCINGILLDIYK